MEVNELSSEANVTETEKSPLSTSDHKEDEITEKLDKIDESESVNSEGPTPVSNLMQSGIDKDCSKSADDDNSEKNNTDENEVEENYLKDNESEDKRSVNNEVEENSFEDNESEDKRSVNNEVEENSFEDNESEDKRSVNNEVEENSFEDNESENKRSVNNEVEENSFEDSESEDKRSVNNEVEENSFEDNESEDKRSVNNENEVEENILEDNESEEKSSVNNKNEIETSPKDNKEILLNVNKDDDGGDTPTDGKITENLTEDPAKEPYENTNCTELPLEASENTEVLKDDDPPENPMEIEEDEVPGEEEKNKNIVLEENKEVLMEFDSDVSENIEKNDENLMKGEKNSEVSVNVEKNDESSMEVESCVSGNVEKSDEISMEVDKNADILIENENSMDIEKNKDNSIELVKDETALENEEKTEKNSMEIVEDKEISLSVKENKEISINVDKDKEISLEIEESKEIIADVAIKEEITIKDEKNEDVSEKIEMKKEISVKAENDKIKEIEEISVDIENDKTKKVEEISLNTGENKVISVNIESKEIPIEVNEKKDLSVNVEEISIDSVKNKEIVVKTGETEEVIKDIEKNKELSTDVDNNEKAPLEVQKPSEILLEVEMIDAPADIYDDDDDDGIEIIDDLKVSAGAAKSITGKDETVHKNIDENKNLTGATDKKEAAAVFASKANTDSANIPNDDKTPMIICNTEDPVVPVKHVDTSMEVDENSQIARLVIEGFEESDNENYIRMTVQEINDYVKEKVNIYMEEKKMNPYTVAKTRIDELLQKIEEKKTEIAKLQKAFESLNKDHVKFLRHMGSMAKVPTKTVGVGIDLEWLPETVSGLFQNNAKSSQIPNGAPVPIKPKPPSGPIECIDLTDDTDIPEPPKLKTAVIDPKNVIITNSSGVSSPAGGAREAVHPAPLPVSTSISTLSASEIPPKPKLNISVDKNGIVLQWDMPPQAKKIKITGYEIYGYQEKENGPVSSTLWKRIGIVNPMALPMSCTLTQFVEGFKYHFAIRGVSNNILGHFSDPASLKFTSKS